jgi:hypothetical protein
MVEKNEISNWSFQICFEVGYTKSMNYVLCIQILKKVSGSVADFKGGKRLKKEVYIQEIPE